MDNDESEGSLEGVAESSDSNDESPRPSVISIPVIPKKKRSSLSTSLTLKPSSSFVYAGVSANDSAAGPWSSAEDIPSSLLNKLLEQLTRQRWVVPVLPKQELEILMEMGISLIRKGVDGSSINFQRFLNEALILAFEKLMQDEAMRDWKLDIHRYIWLRIERFFFMFTEKLRQTLDGDQIPSAFWKVLHLTMSSTSRYHIQNASMDITSLNVDYVFPEAQNFVKDGDTESAWLRLLLVRFGDIGGFELIKLFFERNVTEEVPLSSIIEWISPFASCVSFLKPEIINDVFRHVLDISLKRLRSLDIDTLKCETVKGDLHDSPYMGLPILLRMFFVLIPSSAGEAKELMFFGLKYVLRVLQVAPFAGRIAALEELHSILLNASCDLIMSQKDTDPTLGELAVWLREQSFLEILFRDNLHHLSFCERIERILRVLLTSNAITVRELDIIWNVQRGKHDAIQRNLYDLIAKLINSFSNELQEQLFALMKESWSDSSPRERTLLLDLIRRIGIDFCTASEENLTLKSLSLLWDLFRDERLPVEVGDAALEAHFTILESLSCSNILYRRYIDKCIEELMADSVFVLPTLNHMQKIFQLIPEASFQSRERYLRNDFITNVQHDTDLCARLTNNVSLYMDKVREAVQLLPQKRAEIGTGLLKIDGRYTHEDHLRIRLNFLHFLLSDGQLWLLAPQANELWDALVVNAVTDFERTYGFKLFERMESRGDIDPKALNPFFETRILKFPVEELNLEGFQCFKVFWICVNQAAMKLTVQENSAQYSLVCMDLDGCDYLWEVILKSKEEVSRSAIDLWVEIFSKPDRIDVGMLTESVINKCFAMLKENQGLLDKAEVDEEVKQQAIRHMGRILYALYNYICAFDDDFLLQERLHPPLMRSCMGHCFLLSVLLPSHELEKMHGHLEQRGSCLNFHFPASGVLTNSQNEECTIPVHSNMSLSAVRLLIGKQLRQVYPSLPSEMRFRLYVLRLGLNCPDQMPLEAQGKRKTLGELFIDSSTQLVISFSFTHHILFGSRSPTSDSSLDGSEEMSSAEEDAERMLPGCAIASNSDYVRFLCTLADIGYSHSCSELRDNAEKVLHQIPADLMSVKPLEQMIERDCFYANFPVECPSEILYLLAMLHSLLLPAGGYLQKKATSFQKRFFSSKSCLSVLSFLDYPEIFHLRDATSCCTALWWILNVTKFILSVVARLKFLEMEASEKPLMLHYIQRSLSKDQELYKEFCDVVANDLHRCAGNDEISLEHLETLYLSKSSRLESLMRIAWICGSKPLPLKSALTDEQPPSLLTTPPTDAIGEQQEQLTICALDAVACASIIDGTSELVLNNKSLWSSLVTDLLFCSSSGIQSHVAQVVKRVICRESFTAVRSASETAPDTLAANTVNLLFEKFSNVDQKPDAASEYFSLLCKLLEYCRNHCISLDSKMDKIEKVIEWLESAKQHTIVHMQQYPNDRLLVGYFELCRSLVGCLSPVDKLKLGSEESNRRLVKQILDEFVLPFSRAFVELERAKGSTDKHIQRSATQMTFAGSKVENEASLPRSITVDPIPSSRCVPVCGTGESVKAAYDLLISLCEDCPRNFFVAVNILMEMFYDGPLLATNIEWEYLPGFAARLPNNYVGLKNGGATCYMNSVFQQIFMIEKLRNAILNAKCEVEINVDDGQSDDHSNIFHDKDIEMSQSDYHQVVLKSVQTIFAHLLGSELQFYTPKYFWNHFRFGGQAVNVREQQDALEFYNAIFDSIDEGMKAIGEPPICELLFGGTFADQKICKDCPHWYQREEAFTSISLDIRSHNNLNASLKEYVKGDLLNNDNAYFCEECGRKVTAVKRLCLAKLPPYLTIQLKRFDFDWERDLSQKYNDYFEFPLELDMMPYTAQGLANAEAEANRIDQLGSSLTVEDVGKYMSDSVSSNKSANSPNSETETVDESYNSSTLYRLRGVIVHSGQANGGHYYSFIRSSDDGGQWYKFDDIDVTKWDLSKEEMRNMWFGGDYSPDSYETNCKSYQKRRQKRWWNAYLLIYEKVAPRNLQSLSLDNSNISNSNSPSHSLSSSTHESVTPHIADASAKNFQPAFLNRKMHQMPPKLEALIRGQNTRSMHERSQYTSQYFQFIGDLVSCAIRMSKRPCSTSKELCMCAIQLFSKFLFSTALRAKKSLRGGSMNEWQKSLEYLLSSFVECRTWFVCNVLLQQKLIVSFLLSATALDVRFFFAYVMIAALNLTRSDPIESVQHFCGDLAELGVICSLQDTVSDLLLSVLLTAVRNNFSEFVSHPAQYLFLFHQYASLGLEQKKQLVRKGVLHSLLILVFEEDLGFKAAYHDSVKFFDLISQLMRACDLGTPTPNPYALASSGMEPVSSEVRHLLFDLVFLDKFVKQILEMPSDHDIAIEAVLFLCWENLATSQTVLHQLPFQSMFTPNEVKRCTKVMESILSINDSAKESRLRCVLFGSRTNPVERSYLAVILSQSGTCFWKTYSMLKSLMKIIAENPEVNQMLAGEESFRDRLVQLELWLKNQIQKNDSFSYCCRSNEVKTSSGLERSNSANDLLMAIKKLNEKISLNGESKEVEGKSSTTGAEQTGSVIDAIEVYFPDTKKHPWYLDVPPLKSEPYSEGDWDEKQAYLRNSISADEKNAALKDLPPPPKYTEVETLHNPIMHPNSPVYLTAAGDENENHDDMIKDAENSNSSTEMVEIEKEGGSKSAGTEAEQTGSVADAINVYLPNKKHPWYLDVPPLKSESYSEDWDDKQHYLCSSISADEKNAALKDLPPPPKYTEVEALHNPIIHSNSPVHLTAAGDENENHEDMTKDAENSNSSSDMVEIEKGIQEHLRC